LRTWIQRTFSFPLAPRRPAQAYSNKARAHSASPAQNCYFTGASYRCRRSLPVECSRWPPCHCDRLAYSDNYHRMSPTWTRGTHSLPSAPRRPAFNSLPFRPYNYSQDSMISSVECKHFARQIGKMLCFATTLSFGDPIVNMQYRQYINESSINVNPTTTLKP